jgi:hypothetical protein
MRAYSTRSGVLFTRVSVSAQLDGREPVQWKPSITLSTGEKYGTVHVHCGCLCVWLVVLSVIQEKVNNPSADDPFEPEIAAVSVQT